MGLSHSVAILVVCFAVLTNGMYVTERQYQREFSKFVKTHGKSYTTDDFFTRFEIFKQNLDLIELHNSGNPTSTMGVNSFADMTSNEMAAKMNGYKRSMKKSGNKVAYFTPEELAIAANTTSLDWRTAGAVTGVKDQGQCGSCWSFSATGSIEGAVFLKDKRLTSLSEQQLMDCSQPEGDNSCEGGLMDYAFQFVIDNKGICTEADYPYLAKDQPTCTKTCKPASMITSFVDVPTTSDPNDESNLMAAVMLGPVSIAIEADQPVFQLYTGGVITSAACGTNLDHGVLIVGFGTDSTTGTDYWIVKNSWGAAWGEKGYVRLQRNHDICGLNTINSYPIAA